MYYTVSGPEAKLQFKEEIGQRAAESCLSRPPRQGKYDCDLYGTIDISTVTINPSITLNIIKRGQRDPAFH